ncbi:MAG: hypothetical protein HC780_22510 [Leptolyngbyaceae cyanobacterium CSU_1_3]|nr:hypothetical protein [Leptolyngbyaceae cyanobacterium CSU_1_3]
MIVSLAQWLSVQVPDDYIPLERVWQNQMIEKAPELANYYQTKDKLQLLRQWTEIIKPSTKVKALGRYPLPIPHVLANEFQSFWERQLLRNEGKAMDELSPNQQSGMEKIASVAYTILKTRPNWITRERKRKLSPYLNYQELRDLDSLQPPIQPELLDLEASSKDAMQWVIDQYLPFRRWDAAIHSSSARPRVSDRIADSFVNWILKHYPELGFANSVLNYSVASLVQDLCQKNPVLWVVVDGLGWLDHQELLAHLTQNSRFSVETALEPRISILPTKPSMRSGAFILNFPLAILLGCPTQVKAFR